MKFPKLIKLRFVTSHFRGRRGKRGVAIITVLAIVSLMTVLVISFFNMAQSQKVSAVGTVEIEKAVTLKDTAINFVVAQIREATTLQTGSTKTIWSSQPGGLRTYSSNSQDFNRLYKLYSAEDLVVTNIPPNQGDFLLKKVEADVPQNWDNRPDEFVDLNRPALPSDLSTDQDENSQTRKRLRLLYPIADPNRFNGQISDLVENTEGFRYGNGIGNRPTPSGVNPQRGELAMPVRWIYLLADGTMGVLNGNRFRAISNGGTPSEQNQIVGRIAWWADDETCKINVNTASVPSPWDTPRTNSAEDVMYATRQPVSGEVQRYPGHPAQVDLSAVFFPGYRYTPDTSIIPPGGAMQPLPQNRAQLIWNIAPFITELGGSIGGTTPVRMQNARPVPLDQADHLFASFEELYFKALQADQNLNRRRGDAQDRDPGEELFKRLQRSQFFLTHKSKAPELTVEGLPRVCMFPMNGEVAAQVGRTGVVPPNIGAFEVTMATNSSLGATGGTIRPYYFQRSVTNSNSRHNAFHNEFGGRNSLLFRYLKRLTAMNIEGYPELAGTSFRSLELKYNRPTVIVNGSPRTADNNPSSPDFDASDRSQILLNMLDFIRSSNLRPGYVPNGQAYDSGLGSTAGICGCTSTGRSVQTDHTLAMNSPNVCTPRGTGRIFGAAEIILIANVTTLKPGSGAPVGDTSVVARLTPENATRWNQATRGASIVELGVVMNGFAPKHGWAPLFGGGGMNISGPNSAGGDDPRSAQVDTAAAPTMPISLVSPGQVPLRFGNAVAGLRDGITNGPSGGNRAFQPGRLIPWGGMVGARYMSTARTAILGYAVYTGQGAGRPNPLNVDFLWQPLANSPVDRGKLRVFPYDDPAPDATNTVQCLELDFNPATIPNTRADYTGRSLGGGGVAGIMQDQNLMIGPNTTAQNFPPPKTGVISMVVPHGDYRLTTIPMRVDRGIFVMNGAGVPNAHSVMEPNLVGNTNAQMVPSAGAQLASDQLLADSTYRINAMPPAFNPHLAPVRTADLCNPQFNTQPPASVLQVASSSNNQLRALRFAHGRRDGQGLVPNRGSSDPLETGDFDNGVGLAPDGPYMNHPDDGDSRATETTSNPYYYAKIQDVPTSTPPGTFSPNRLMRSPVDFGSVPSGINARVPWQTLRFRPDPGMNDPQLRIRAVNDVPKKPQGFSHLFPFANYCGPKDHLILDMFWMPIVEPWSISEGFATKGAINLNQQIFPFTYIERTTALHALFRGTRMMAIPNTASQRYKDGNRLNDNQSYRYWINARETVRQITEFRFRGLDAEGFPVPFSSFRTPSEICELWLVPDMNNASSSLTLNQVIREFWSNNRLTGDNVRERPYSELYPRLCTRSDTYKVHVVAQAVKKALNSDPVIFDSTPGKDVIMAEWRGSAMIERNINPRDPAILRLPDYVTVTNLVTAAKLDDFYTYRVTEVHQVGE
ncbi:MAG: hypothetical protein DVB22_000730 [Verrucomicrobia bacterium]|nr:MAG: hypothetical protein DVB22_000730 [Verrucomicrobiota bacterium]